MAGLGLVSPRLPRVCIYTGTYMPTETLRIGTPDVSTSQIAVVSLHKQRGRRDNERGTSRNECTKHVHLF